MGGFMSNTLNALNSLGNVGEHNRNQKIKEQQIAQNDLLLAKQQQEANDQNMLRAELQSPLGGVPTPGVPGSPEGLQPVPPDQLPNPDRIALEYWQQRDPKIAMDIYKNIAEKAKDIAERTGDPKQAVAYFNEATGLNAEFKGMKGTMLQVQVDGQTHLIEYNPVGGTLETKMTLGEKTPKLVAVGEKSRLYDAKLGKVVVDGKPDDQNVPVKSEHNIKGPDGKPKTLLIYKDGRREYLDSVPSPSAVINAGAIAAQRQFSNEHQLRTQFLNIPEVKERPVIEQQLTRVQAAMDEAKKGGSKIAVDQTLVTSFNKMLDANSVVRESEYARTSQDLSLLNRIRGGYEKLIEGGAGLTDEDRAALYSMIDRFGDASTRAYGAQVDQYTELANSYGFDPRRVTRLGFGKEPAAPKKEAAPAATSKGPKIGTVEKDAQGRDRIFTGGNPAEEKNWRLK